MEEQSTQYMCVTI